MQYTLRDHIEDFAYMAGTVWPARLAAPACIEAAGLVGHAALACGLRRLAIRVAIWAYDIADHDPADATWGTHRRLFSWAYCRGSFRPTHMIAARILHERRYGEMA